MKNNDDQRLLARQQQIDNERQAQAILRQRARARANAEAMARIARLRSAS